MSTIIVNCMFDGQTNDLDKLHKYFDWFMFRWKFSCIISQIIL